MKSDSDAKYASVNSKHAILPDNCPNQELFFELNVKQEHVTNDVYDNDENIEKKSAGVQKLTHRQPSRLRREKCDRTDNCQTEKTHGRSKNKRKRVRNNVKKGYLNKPELSAVKCLVSATEHVNNMQKHKNFSHTHAHSHKEVHY